MERVRITGHNLGLLTEHQTTYYIYIYIHPVLYSFSNRSAAGCLAGLASEPHCKAASHCITISAISH